MARPNDSAAISKHVQGLREAKAAFQALPEIVRDRLNEAIEVTGKEIVRNAQAKLRASPAIRTRALHDHVAFLHNKKSGKGKVGIKTGTTTLTVAEAFGPSMRIRKIKVKGIITPGKGGGAAGAKKIQPTRYAHLIEFGRKKAPAEPFMLPSAKAEEQPFLQRIRAKGPSIERDMANIGMRNL